MVLVFGLVFASCSMREGGREGDFDTGGLCMARLWSGVVILG